MRFLIALSPVIACPSQLLHTRVRHPHLLSFFEKISCNSNISPSLTHSQWIRLSLKHLHSAKPRLTDCLLQAPLQRIVQQ